MPVRVPVYDKPGLLSGCPAGPLDESEEIMTRRERKERKIELRKEWARKRSQKADQADESVSRLADQIPLGQPILVGHHSERHARRDIERIQNGMDKVVENQKMAVHHEQVAAGIQYQLDHTIFSDDPDAVERLDEKIRDLETKRDRMKIINASIKSGYGLTDRLQLTDREKAELLSLASCTGKPGYPSFMLTNIGAKIRTAKKRRESLK